MLVSLGATRRDEGDEIEAVGTRGLGNARFVLLEEPPNDRGEANRIMPANLLAATVLVVAQRQVNLAHMLAIGDRNHRIEAVRLVAALEASVEVRALESPADLAARRPCRSDVPHRPLIRLAGLLDPYRHRRRG